MTKLKLEKQGEIRVRIAPSPTGPLHVGTARVTLFNFLFAEKNKGKLILRIEDTDKERSKKRWEKDIIENLKWLGLKWSEGPYRQSERSHIYFNYLKKLLEEEKAYYCFCSEEELEAHRKYLFSIGQPPVYSEKCADLSQKDIENNFKEGKNATIRFKIPSKKIKIKDLVRKELEFDTSLIGDMVIAKNVKSPVKENDENIQYLYNFVVVIDDFEMKISHIIRGEDHISNSPKQILIQESLNFPRPEYAHLPLILGTDRSKLSKRNAVTSLNDYREKGYLPEALINFMALLGWNPGDDREIFSIDSLIKEFSLEKVQKSGAILNIEKLNSINGFYIRQKPIEKLTQLCIPYLIESDLITPFFEDKQYPPAYGGKEIVQNYKINETGEKISFEYLKKAVSLYHERLKIISEIPELIDFFFKDKLEYPNKLLGWKDMTNEEIENLLDKLIEILSKIDTKDWNFQNLKEILTKEAEKVDIREKNSRGYLLWPLRASLTGKKASAGPFEVAELLGKERALRRVKQAKDKLT